MAEKCYPEGVLKEEKDLLSAMSSRQDKKLPREIILKSKSEIDRVIKSGKKVTRDSFNIFVRQSEQTRAAFLVSKKIGTAVMRNRMKRLFREGYRLNKDNFLDKEVVIIINRFINNFQKIFTEIEKIK